ncbi:MAG: nucleotidyltransferase family protein [Bacteroidia bacterium]|nr:nucleotidyltransferase family protein [Bacteroidia bacterium]
MKAMIFAAGLGTRLAPLTNTKPKALIEINGVALLEIVIKNLIKQGITDIIVNVHHLVQSIIDFLDEKQNFGINICISVEKEKPLETGGGLMKASWFFNDDKPFLVHNVDIIANIDFNKMYDIHLQSGNIATLAVRNRKTSRYFLFDKYEYLCGWENMKNSEIRITRKPASKLHSLAFSGIQILSPEIFNFIEEKGVFSITDVYIRLAADHKIGNYHDDDSLWIDIGNVENLRLAEKIFLPER